MKKVEELLDVLGKIDPVYIEEAEKTRFVRRTKYWIPVAACVALLVLGGTYGLLQLDGGKMQESDAAMESAAALPDSPVKEESAEYAVGAELGKGEVLWNVNEVEDLQTAVACGAAPARTEYYTTEELETYYGIRILPGTLPDGFEPEEAERGYAVSYGDDGEVMDDNCKLVYQNGESGGRLEISARTVDMGEITSFADTGLRTSEIYGTKVTVGHYRTKGNGSSKADGYLAIYEKDGVTVTVEGTGIDEETFRAVLEDLLL